ncbi:hypothetical protein MASR1M66_23260 [Aminivibrio sp.]
MEALKAGQVDAVMETSTLPDAHPLRAFLTHDLVLRTFAPGYRDKLIAEMPQYLPLSVPAGTYKGIDHGGDRHIPAPCGASGRTWTRTSSGMVKAAYSPEGLAYIRKDPFRVLRGCP